MLDLSEESLFFGGKKKKREREERRCKYKCVTPEFTTR